MPRAIWTGTISFGLVNVPVRMYSAVSEHDLHFNLLHEPDHGRIGYQKICKAENEPVPNDEIVKAFELEKGEFVVLSDEDFEAVEAEAGAHTIEITDFVPYEDIDPIFFERTYYLGPQDGSEKVYALLRESMEQAGLAAVARFVMRDKQHLGVLRVREGTITLERMFFADEIRDPGEVAPKQAKVEKRELEMAASLIDQFSGDWKPERYTDDYRERLCERIRAKQKGETVKVPDAEADEEPTDLLAALRASVEAAQRSRGGSRAEPQKRKAPARKQSRRSKTSTRHS